MNSRNIATVKSRKKNEQFPLVVHSFQQQSVIAVHVGHCMIFAYAILMVKIT